MTEQATDTLRYAIASQNKPRLSNARLRKVLEGIEHADQQSLLPAESIESARQIDPSDLMFADRVIETNRELGILALTITDPRYPRFLRAVKNPPAIIYVRGDAGVLANLPGVAVVGTRNATDNGLEIARRLGRFFGESGWPVISGLALGIDAAAHKGTIESGGQTVAVLAGGLDKPSPKKNEELAEDILASGGIWISEHPVGVPPKRQHFVPRNRIQVGLAAGSIIVEAEERSGSISQANYCLDFGRLLFAIVPEDERNSLGLKCAGTEYLVRERGATPIRSKSDYDNTLRSLGELRRSLHEA